MGLADAHTRPEDAPETVVQALLDRPRVAVRLLDAARACALDRGISRVTMSDVARRADVSRTTLYRHYPDVETLLRDLVTLDFGSAVLAARRAAGGGTAREIVVRTAVEGCRRVRRDPLFHKILDVDPEFLLPYVTARTGVSQRVVLTLLEGGVADGQADGSVRAGDPAVIGRLLLVQVQALTISLGAVTDGDVALEEEILALTAVALDAQLRPVEA